MEKILLLNQLENQVESHLQQALITFQNTANEVLLKPSNTGGWSVVQCLEHLNIYGNYYLPLFEKTLAESTNKPDADYLKSTWLGRKVIEFMNPKTGQKKFKAFNAYIPMADLDTQAVVAEFINQQERLVQVLRIAQTKDIQQIKIPIAIATFLKLTFGDALQFVIVHTERHIQQANRNL